MVMVALVLAVLELFPLVGSAVVVESVIALIALVNNSLVALMQNLDH